MNVDTMIQLSARVGVTLSFSATSDGGCGLYAWARSRGDVVYVGKRVSAKRTVEEFGFFRSGTAGPLARYVQVDRNGAPRIVSAFVAGLSEIAADWEDGRDYEPAPLLYGGFDPAATRHAIRQAASLLAEASHAYELAIEASDTRAARFERWLTWDFIHGPNDWLIHPEMVRVIDVERFLVRLLVRTGQPMLNSQFAGQWEGMLDTAADTLAVIALILHDSR